MGAKRFFDVAVSIAALILALPLLIIILLVVYIKLGSPVLFIQERVGRGSRIFKMYKFRTMLDTKDKDGNLLRDENRLIPFGRLLRSTSLDELPELINVIKGDMSLVGPRPLLVDYLSLYSERQMKRHEVLPGITGWAQVNGRNSITWWQKLELDVWYVENRSFWLDLRIMFMTVAKVFRQEDIHQDGRVTVERFNGIN